VRSFDANSPSVTSPASRCRIDARCGLTGCVPDDTDGREHSLAGAPICIQAVPGIPCGVLFESVAPVPGATRSAYAFRRVRSSLCSFRFALATNLYRAKGSSNSSGPPAIVQWRSKQGWPETIHFSETGADKVDRAVSLLQQHQSRRSGVLFLGYSLTARGRTHEVLVSLFIQLVVDR